MIQSISCRSGALMHLQIALQCDGLGDFRLILRLLQLASLARTDLLRPTRRLAGHPTTTCGLHASTQSVKRSIEHSWPSIPNSNNSSVCPREAKHLWPAGRPIPALFLVRYPPLSRRGISRLLERLDTMVDTEEPRLRENRLAISLSG